MDDNNNKISTLPEVDGGKLLSKENGDFHKSDVENSGAIVNSFYYFEDYPDKTVLELCKQYYDELNEACRVKS